MRSPSRPLFLCDLRDDSVAFLVQRMLDNQDSADEKTAAEFDRADTNHDGKVSRDELNVYIVNQIFDSRDTNHDGRMTQQEWTGGDPARVAAV